MFVGVPAVFIGDARRDRTSGRHARRTGAAPLHLRWRCPSRLGAAEVGSGDGLRAASGLRPHRGGAGLPLQSRRCRRIGSGPWAPHIPRADVTIRDPFTDRARCRSAPAARSACGAITGRSGLRVAMAAVGLPALDGWLHTGDQGDDRRRWLRHVRGADQADVHAQRIQHLSGRADARDGRAAWRDTGRGARRAGTHEGERDRASTVHGAVDTAP